MNDGTKRSLVFCLLVLSGISGCGGKSNLATQQPDSGEIQVSKYGTFDAALAACPETGACTLYVPAGSFATSRYGKNCISRSNTSILGSGQPTYDDVNAPTKLVGGTILQPGLGFCGASSVTVSDLGVDDGPTYVAAGGAVVDGFVYEGINASNPSDPLWVNNRAERITSLGSSSGAAVHAFLFEHGSGMYFDKLLATYDTHCIAVKADHVTGGSVSTQACSSDQVIVKSDDYTAVSDVDVASISVKSLAANDSQNGVVIDSEALVLPNFTSGVHIGSIQAAGIYSAVTFLADGAVGDGAVNHVTIDALRVDATSVSSGPDCLQSTAATGQIFEYISLSNVQCNQDASPGGFTATRLYSPMFNTQIHNWTTTGQVNAAYLDGGIEIKGWSNEGAGAAEPVFYLIGGTSTNISVDGFKNSVPGSTVYASDGTGESIKVTP